LIVTQVTQHQGFTSDPRLNISLASGRICQVLVALHISVRCDLLLIGSRRLSNFAVLLACRELQLTQGPASTSSIGLCELDSKIASFASKGHREVPTKLSNDIRVSLTVSIDFGIHCALRLVMHVHQSGLHQHFIDCTARFASSVILYWLSISVLLIPLHCSAS